MADCEQLHGGVLDEPVNAVSSLAYVAAGVYVWRRDRRAGAALVAVGAGSIAFHGPGGTVARFLHDATILVVAVVVATGARRIRSGVRERPVVAAGAVGAMSLALPLQLFGRTGGALCRPESIVQAHAGWHALTAVALACAFTLARRPRARSEAVL